VKDLRSDTDVAYAASTNLCSECGSNVDSAWPTPTNRRKRLGVCTTHQCLYNQPESISTARLLQFTWQTHIALTTAQINTPDYNIMNHSQIFIQCSYMSNVHFSNSITIPRFSEELFYCEKCKYDQSNGKICLPIFEF